MEINKKNLPVLYTMPRWKLETGSGSKKSYFVPWIGKYVSKNSLGRELSKINRTIQDYYDRWILNITVPSQRPRCEFDGCKCEVAFINLFVNYSRGYCSDSLHHKVVSNSHKARKLTEDHKKKQSESIKKHYKDNPGLSKKIGESISRTYREHPEKKEIQRQHGIKRYQDPNEVLRSSNIMKELHRKGVFLNVSRGYGIKSEVYSIWENKVIHLDSTWESNFFSTCEGLKVDRLLRCPFIIKYNRPSDNSIVPSNYYPDFLLNNHYLIEVKPNYMLDDEVNIAKFNAADLYCRENGLEYVILTEDYLFNNGEPFYGSMPF